MTHRMVPAVATVVATAVLRGCADATPDLPRSLEALAFDTAFVVGGASGEPWQAFEGIWDIEVDADGRLAILDLGGPAVHVYDALGTHVATLDEPGLDEGQLDDPTGLAWATAGELLVWDPGSSWISRFRARGDALEFQDRWRAFAFGETGFCAADGRAYLSYWHDGQVVHEIVPGAAPRPFGEAPRVVGAETLGPELREIAVEELTPSALLCTGSGVLDVGFVQSRARLHGWDGNEIWSHELDDFRPIVVYSEDGIGLGRGFDEGEGSHLLRSVVPWGSSAVLVQHELRMREIPEEGDVEVIESRLLDLADGSELARTRTLPLVLAAHGRTLFLPRQEPFPTVMAVTVR